MLLQPPLFWSFAILWSDWNEIRMAGMALCGAWHRESRRARHSLAVLALGAAPGNGQVTTIPAGSFGSPFAHAAARLDDIESSRCGLMPVRANHGGAGHLLKGAFQAPDKDIDERHVLAKFLPVAEN